MRVFNLPDLGEGLQEATIVEWHVKPGDSLAADQAMVSVETDKAIVEVPAPFDGQVEKLFADVGDAVHVGAPLIGFQGTTEDTGTVVGVLAETKATPAVRSLARSLSVDLAKVSDGLMPADWILPAPTDPPPAIGGAWRMADAG